MPAYIIRLDDACPTMNHKNWSRVDQVLKKHGVKPIVGVIPDNQDPDFSWEKDDGFWEKMRAWEKEGYTIALHGLHHKYLPAAKRDYFQRSHGVNTEFASIPLEKQRNMIEEGMRILREHGLTPECFFAPAHTFDLNTVKVLSEQKEIKFVSDGYAIAPYIKAGMVFLPSICDGPVPFPVGIHTFVFHPSTMTEDRFAKMESFLNDHGDKVTTPERVLERIRPSQGLVGRTLEWSMYVFRGLRSAL